MAKKITNITLVHECDESNCHLDNQEQTKWIENILPKEKLEWNWKLTVTAKDAMDKGYLNQGIGKYIKQKEEENFLKR